MKKGEKHILNLMELKCTLGCAFLIPKKKNSGVGCWGGLDSLTVVVSEVRRHAHW